MIVVNIVHLRLGRATEDYYKMTQRIIIVIIIVFLVMMGWILLKPVNIKSLVSNPNPAPDYTEAVKRIAALQTQDTEAINPVCGTVFLTHGQKVKRAIVFLHGFTNCPQQFRQLGEIFYERGYNVLIPRMPHHGLIDRMTTEQAQLTAEELVAFADETVDVVQGLGDEVTIAGASMGGVVTGWITQNRNDVDNVVLMSPVFGLKVLSTWLTRPATNLFLALPNFYQWWNPEKKADLVEPKHAYPRFASRALAQVLRLSLAVQASARQSKPLPQSILVITNSNDTSVNADLITDVVNSWRRNGVDNLRTYEFKADLELEHDFIDPGQKNQPIDVVYPILVDLITTAGAKE